MKKKRVRYKKWELEQFKAENTHSAPFQVAIKGCSNENFWYNDLESIIYSVVRIGSKKYVQTVEYIDEICKGCIYDGDYEIIE